MDLRQGGASTWTLSLPPEGGLPKCLEGSCRKAGLGRGACSGVEWHSGCPRIHSVLAPLGPLCSEGGKATEGFCHWAGAGSRELLSWLRSVAWRGPVGLLRSGRIPGFSSTGRYCTEQEEVPRGGRKPGQLFLFALFHTPGIMGFF